MKSSLTTSTGSYGSTCVSSDPESTLEHDVDRKFREFFQTNTNQTNDERKIQLTSLKNFEIYDPVMNYIFHLCMAERKRKKNIYMYS